MTTYFTSDQHYDHANIIKFCSRPFDNAHQMNEALIANHNNTVGRNDDVIMLGDVVFKSSEKHARNLLSRLNGNLFLVGNHDKTTLKCSDMFHWVKPIHELTIHDLDARGNKRLIVMCHYAMKTWNKSHHGSWNIFGHSHGGLPDDPKLLSIDVGVDAIAKMKSVKGVLLPEDYRPISYEELKTIMVKRTKIKESLNEAQKV